MAGKGDLPIIGVRVAPDTARFGSELDTKLKHVEKTTTARIKVVPQLDRASLRKVKEQLDRLSGTASVRVALDKASLLNAKRKLAALGGTAKVKVDLDRSALDKLSKTLGDLDKPRTIKPPKVDGDNDKDRDRRRREDREDLNDVRSQLRQIAKLKEKLSRIPIAGEDKDRLVQVLDKMKTAAGTLSETDTEGQKKLRDSLVGLTREVDKLSKASDNGSKKAVEDLGFVHRALQRIAKAKLDTKFNDVLTEKQKSDNIRRLQELDRAVRSGIRPTDYDLRANLERQLSQAQAVANRKPVKVGVDGSGLPAAVRAALRSVEGLTAEIQADTKLNPRKVNAALAELSRMGSKLKIDPELDNAELARVLARVRQIKAEVKVEPVLSRAWANVGKMTRTFTKPITTSQALRSSLPFDAIGNSLRKATTKLVGFTASMSAALATTTLLSSAVSSLVPALTAVGAVGINAIGGLAAMLEGLGSGLVLASGAALALPGLLAGGITGFATFAASVKYSVQHIEGLGTALSQLRENITSASWEAGGKRLQDAFNSLWPIINDGVTRIAATSGEIIGQIADGLMSGTGVASLRSVLDNTNEAMQILKGSTRDFTEALLQLVDVGAQYLPRLAGWMADLSDRFSEWVTAAADSGAIFDWIDTGIVQLGLLWDALVATKDIIRGLFDAMSAGYAADGLAPLVAGLERVSGFINGSDFQGAIGGLFADARSAAGELKVGIDALWQSFVKTEDVIGRVMNMSGAGFGALLESLGNALGSDAWTTRLESMIKGFADGMAGFAPAMQPILEIVGALGDAIGRIATSLGPAMADVLERIAPTIIGLFDQLGASAPALADGIAGFFDAVAQGLAAMGDSGALQDLFTAISDTLPVLGQAVGQLLPLLPPLLSAIIPMVAALAEAFSEVAPRLIPIVEAVSRWVQDNPELALQLLALAAVAGPLITVLGAVAGVVSALVGLWPVLAPVVAGIVAALTGPLGIVAAVGVVVAGIYLFRDEIVAAFGKVLETLTQWGTNVGEAFSGIWGSVSKAAFSVGETLGGMLQGPTTALQNGLGHIHDAFSSFGDGLRGMMTDLMDWFTDLGIKMAERARSIAEGVAGIFGDVGQSLADITGLDGSGIGASWNDISRRFAPDPPPAPAPAAGGAGVTKVANVTVNHPTGNPTDESVRRAAEMIRF